LAPLSELLVAIGRKVAQVLHKFHVAQLDQTEEALNFSAKQCHALALSGTAVAPGLNAPSEFSKRAIAYLTEQTSQPWGEAENKFAALTSHEALAGMSSASRTLDASLLKIASDIRWMGSGYAVDWANPSYKPTSKIGIVKAIAGSCRITNPTHFRHNLPAIPESIAHGLLMAIST
jgi:fumarate hydratase class II